MKFPQVVKLAFFFCAVMLSAAAEAQFIFSTNAGALTIVAYTGTGPVVIIPPTTNSLPIVSIGTNAFVSKTTVSNVVVPDNVTEIQGRAFASCSGLTNISLGNGVIFIRDGAFSGCTTLTNITLPASLTTIGPGAFSTSSRLASIIIPNNVTSIGFNAFLLCKALTNVVLGTSLTNIGSEAFDNCTNLLSITIPNSVMEIDSNAFISCYNLTNVAIGTGLTNLGGEVWDLCTNLLAFTVDPGNPALSSLGGVLFNKSQSLLIQYPPGNAATSYAIPGTVKEVGLLAFDTSTHLTNITIPFGVVSFDDAAFHGCVSVVNFAIPNSVANIGLEAFGACGSLTTETFPASVTNIAGPLFALCLNLTNLTVDPANPAYASLDGVLLDKNMTAIIQFPEGKAGNYTVPNTVKNIANSTFGACLNLTGVDLGTGVTNIDDFAFNQDSALAYVTLHNGLVTIGQAVFASCTNLTTITIPASVISFSNFAFFGCSALTSVYFESNAPLPGSLMFTLDNLTCYYLPNTTGWSSTYSGMPAVLWNPMAQNDAAFGVQTNRFGFNVTGTSGIKFVVEGTTNLSHPAWQPLQTNTITGGLVYFNDAQWTNFPNRFYRIRSP